MNRPKFVNRPNRKKLSSLDIALDPFLISCPTCRANLKVRKPEAIGRIVSCPKCSGMVRIHSPAPTPAGSISGNPHNDEVAHSGANPKTFESTCEQIDQILDGSPNGPPPQVAEHGPRWKGGLSSHVDAMRCKGQYTEAELNKPTRDWWVSNRVRARRRQVLLGLIAIATVGLTASVGWMNYQPREKDSHGMAGAEVHALGTTAGEALASPTQEAATETHHLQDGNSESMPAAPRTSAAAVTFAVHQTKVITEDSAVIAAAHEESADDHSGEPSTPTTSTNDNATRGSGRQAVDHFGDLFRAPAESGTDPSNKTRATNTRSTSASAPKRDQSIKRLELPPLLRATLTTAVATRKSDSLPKKPIDVEARLADSIVDVNIDVGLNDLLGFLSQLSTIPFTVRPEALRYSRITPTTPTPANAAQSTVGELLRRSLSQHKLDLQAIPGHVIIDRQGAVSGKYTTNKHNVGDLIDSGVLPAELTSLVQQLVSPASWFAIDRQAKAFVQEQSLVLNHTETAHFETMFLLERLRAARGMSLQGTMDREEFTNDWQRTAELNQPIALRTRRGDTLGSVLQKLDGLAGNEYHILVDWAELTAAGWQKSDRISLEISRQPLATALHEILSPLGLAHRCVGPRMIEITSAAAAANRYEIGFHPIGSLTQAGYEPETVVHQVETTIGEQNFRRHGGYGAIVYNDGAQSLLVRLPQSQHAAVDWVIRELAKDL